MGKIIKTFVILFFALQSNAQEIKATISINTDKVSGSNKQVFVTLEKDLIEFVNQKKWTDKIYKKQEKLEVSFLITITAQNSSGNFEGNIQVQSSRPVYGSSYQTNVFNFRDSDFSFKYAEYENFQYNPNKFDSNLISVMAYYVYLTLGLDADTFSMMGGSEYYDEAENVVSQAQQGGYIGWSSTNKGITRYMLITDILSGAYDGYRFALYNYHMKGLDLMSSDKSTAKANIESSLQDIKGIYDRRPNASLIRLFFDAKADEIVDIFSDGPRLDTSKLIDDLSRMSPANLQKWNSIE
ncbi:MAG: DUF4835 family protein [Flavobacteriaceae bacterium]|nr:DUF4835 family protein [Flavobacteriaceae bacterium]